jgi:hypothetical protein
LVRALAEQTGLSRDQIRKIIALVGFDRASILREASQLKSRNGG